MLQLLQLTHVIGNLRVGLVASDLSVGELAVSAEGGGADGLGGEEGDGDGLDDGHGCFLLVIEKNEPRLAWWIQGCLTFPEAFPGPFPPQADRVAGACPFFVTLKKVCSPIRGLVLLQPESCALTYFVWPSS